MTPGPADGEEYEIYEGATFAQVSVKEFQRINRMANEDGLMAKIIFIEDSPFGRILDFKLVRMDDYE